MYAGGFYVPLNPDLPPARLRQIQSVLQANYVITDRATGSGPGDFSPEAILDVEELLAAPLQPARLEAVRSQAGGHRPAVHQLHLWLHRPAQRGGGEPPVVIDFIDTFVDCFGMDHTDILANQAPFDFDVSVKDLYTMLKPGQSSRWCPRSSSPGPRNCWTGCVTER